LTFAAYGNWCAYNRYPTNASYISGVLSSYRADTDMVGLGRNANVADY
jgi:hypothetical protein